MTSTIIDRLNGMSGSAAIKLPARLATTAPINLYGLQTIDGVTTDARDRVLVKNQADAKLNGVYYAVSGDWQRAPDFNGSLDAVGGTLIHVTTGSVNSGTYWDISGDGPLVVGRDDIVVVPSLVAPPINASMGVPVTLFGAIFDGRDNTAAITAARNYAVAIGAKKLILPSGDTLLSANIQLPAGLGLFGQGRNVTRIRKTADYGWMFTFGSVSVAYQGAGASGFWAYHDYGTGLFPPNDPNMVTHPCTTGGIIDAIEPSHCVWSDLAMSGGIGQWRSVGGVSNVFLAVETYAVWDPSHAELQGSLSSWFIDGGGANTIPTDFDWVACSLRGTITAVRTINWDGSHTTSTPQNIGAYYTLYIRCMESGRFTGGYIGAAARAGVRLFPRAGGIVTAFTLSNSFIDACHRAGLMFDNTDGQSPTEIQWAPGEHNGQFNGFSAISDEDCNTAVPSVIGLQISGSYRAFVGCGFNFKRAFVVNFSSGTTVRGWNCHAFYDGNSGNYEFNAGVRVEDNVEGMFFNGWWGGGLAGDGVNSHDQYAIAYTDSTNPARVTIGAYALGVSTSLKEVLA